MSLRLLIAPDKFKGSLSAEDAARALVAGFRAAEFDAQFDVCPIADGGEGFMETVASAIEGQWIETESVDALNRSIHSRYLLTRPDGVLTAVIEMAETAGMWRLSSEELDPRRATTRGVGMQIANAIERYSVDRIVLGLGGSATNDGGCGMASALGIRFLDAKGALVDPIPHHLRQVDSIDRSDIMPLPPITVACDVDNPLLGPQGATAVFSPQKGARSEDLESLEDSLAHVVAKADAHDQAFMPGAGAAGGLGFGLIHFASAQLVSGFDLVAQLLGLDERVRAADWIVTGEGSLDAQSLGGKAPVALAKRARQLGKPVVAFCGAIDGSVVDAAVFDCLFALSDTGLPRDRLMREAALHLAQLAESASKELRV